MPRQATGTVDYKGTPPRWHARISVPVAGRKKPARPWVNLERPDIPNTPEGKEHARRLARRHAKLAKERGTFVGCAALAGDPTTLTIGELEEKWGELIDADPDYKPATRYGLKSIFRTHVATTLGKEPVTIGTPALRAFFREKRQTHGGQTVRNVANALTRFFADVKAEGWAPLAFNPMRAEEVRDVLPKLESLNPEDIAHFARDVFEKLLAAPTTPEDRAGLYAVAVLTGMRDGELHGLRFGDLAEEKGVKRASVVRQALYPRGNPEVLIGDPKSKWGRRKIPLHPVALAWLAKWQETGWRAFVGRKPTDGDYVFPDAKGNVCRPDCAALVRDDLGAAELSCKFRTGTGEEVDLDFHSIRHTFATWLAAKGVNGDLVNRLLGQAPKTVRGRHYAAPSLDQLAKGVAAIDLEVPWYAPPAPKDDSSGNVPGNVPGSKTPRNEGVDSATSTTTHATADAHDPACFPAGRGDTTSPDAHLRKPQVVSSNLILGSGDFARLRGRRTEETGDGREQRGDGEQRMDHRLRAAGGDADHPRRRIEGPGRKAVVQA